ncbi:MAG: hypothetical protein WCK13_12785 [Ignavibacteriota bacterium]
MLAPLQFDSKKHSGIIAYFIKYYVKEELIEKNYSNIINSARTNKQLRVKTCTRWQRKEWNADDAERTDKR